MRTYIYPNTEFRIFLAGGRYHPQYRNYNMCDWASFKEHGQPISRARQVDAARQIKRRAKIVDPTIRLVTPESERAELIARLRELLAKKMDPTYWKQLTGAGLEALVRNVNITYDLLFQKGVPEAAILQVEIEAGMYHLPAQQKKETAG